MSAALEPRKPRTYARYSDSRKAIALAALDANGGNLTLTSKQLKVPIKTLSQWRDGQGVVDEVAELRIEGRRDMASKLEEVSHLIADSLPSKIDKAGLKDSAVALGVVIDKTRLLRELPTTITATAHSKEQLVAEIATRFGLSSERAALIAGDVFNDPAQVGPTIDITPEP